MRIEYVPALENFKIGKVIVPALVNFVSRTTNGEPLGVMTFETMAVFAGTPFAVAIKVAPVFRLTSSILLENTTTFEAFVEETL